MKTHNSKIELGAKNLPLEVRRGKDKNKTGIKLINICI